VSTERAGAWTLEIRDDVRRSYAVQASLATLNRPFVPCTVTLDGRPLARAAWSYAAGDQTLRAELATRNGRLEVRPCAKGGPGVAARTLPSTGLAGQLGALAVLAVGAALAAVARRRSSRVR
jgi:hypothetical protein